MITVVFAAENPLAIDARQKETPLAIKASRE